MREGKGQITVGLDCHLFVHNNIIVFVQNNSWSLVTALIQSITYTRVTVM